MKRFWLFFLLLVAGLAGCRSNEAPLPTATPADGTALLVARDAVDITLADLATMPETVEGKLLRVTGAFTPLPTLVCSGEAHPSPATWGLTGDGALAYASGFSQLRRLAPEGLQMTVEGRWRVWRGPVGCGKQAVFSEVWYLDVTRIVAPETIARVTLTPLGGSDDVLAQLDTPTPGDAPGNTATPSVEAPPTAVSPSPAPSPTGEEEEAPATLSPTATRGFGDETPLPGLTLTPTLIFTATTPALTVTAGSGTPTTGTPGTPAATATAGTPGTPTATATAGTPGTPSPTATAGTPGPGTPSPTASATATTVASKTVVDMGEMDDMFLAVEQLGSGEIHSWDLTVTSGNTITAYVASLTENVVLSLLNDAGTVILRQDGNNTTGVETLVQTISTSGIYRLHVETATGAPSDYVMMIRYNESYAFILRGTLQYGDSKSIRLGAEQDHFWHFLGTAGDEVTITVAPDAASDPFMKLYDTEAEDASGFVDDGFTGDSETLTFTLPETGLYSIRIGEFNFSTMDYTIVIVKN